MSDVTSELLEDFKRNPAPSRTRLAVLWGILPLLLSMIPLLALGLREDLNLQSFTPIYWIYVLSLGSLSLSSAALTWKSGIPAQPLPSWLKRVCLITAFAVLMSVAVMGAQAWVKAAADFRRMD